MKKVVDRSLQPISLEPMFESQGLLLTIHGESPKGNSVTALSLREARLLAYGLLSEAELQQSDKG